MRAIRNLTTLLVVGIAAGCGRPEPLTPLDLATRYRDCDHAAVGSAGCPDEDVLKAMRKWRRDLSERVMAEYFDAGWGDRQRASRVDCHRTSDDAARLAEADGAETSYDGFVVPGSRRLACTEALCGSARAALEPRHNGAIPFQNHVAQALACAAESTSKPLETLFSLSKKWGAKSTFEAALATADSRDVLAAIDRAGASAELANALQVSARRTKPALDCDELDDISLRTQVAKATLATWRTQASCPAESDVVARSASIAKRLTSGSSQDRALGCRLAARLPKSDDTTAVFEEAARLALFDERSTRASSPSSSGRTNEALAMPDSNNPLVAAAVMPAVILGGILRQAGGGADGAAGPLRFPVREACAFAQSKPAPPGRIEVGSTEPNSIAFRYFGPTAELAIVATLPKKGTWCASTQSDPTRKPSAHVPCASIEKLPLWVDAAYKQNPNNEIQATTLTGHAGGRAAPSRADIVRARLIMLPTDASLPPTISEEFAVEPEASVAATKR